MRPIVVLTTCLALQSALTLVACEDERRPANEPTNPDAPFQPRTAKNDGDEDAGPPLSGTCASDSDCTWRGYVCLREPNNAKGTCVRFDPQCPQTGFSRQPCMGMESLSPDPMAR